MHAIQASIDLDQQLMEKYLDAHTDEGFDVARDVYQKGAFSRSYAKVTLEKPLTVDVKQGATVRGFNVRGEPMTGTLRRSYKSAEMKKQLDVLYEMDDDEDPTTGCYVGANPEPITDWCT